MAAVAAATAEAASWQNKAATATDPTAKAMATMMASAAQDKATAAITQLQHNIDSTNSFLDNMQLGATITQITSGLGTNLAGAIALFKK